MSWVSFYDFSAIFPSNCCIIVWLVADHLVENVISIHEESKVYSEMNVILRSLSVQPKVVHTVISSFIVP